MNFKNNKKNIKKYIIFPFIGVGILSFLFYLSLLFYTGRNVYLDNKKPSDAILVLGAKSYRGNDYNPCLVARVEHAVSLYQENFTRKLIFSGGNNKEDGINEAETMRKIALDLGVPENDILLEKRSTSTFENIQLSKNILIENNFDTVIIVTEPFHVQRALMVAENAELNYTISSAKESQCWNRWKYLSRYFLREPFAIIKYWFEKKV